MTWDDINFENNSIRIDKATVFDGNTMVTKVPKTRKPKRKITLPQSVMRLIKQYKIE